ncbi:MAG: hypothetical protein KF754_16385 [Planctomycetes bacterium]|nr:hypothetical protein [Planctomycetota bacterium]
MNLKPLARFVRLYFHQDWIDEQHSSDPDRPILAFLRDEQPEEVALVIDALTELLRARLSEGAVREIVMNDMRCGYQPDADGLTVTQWLQHVVNVLSGMDREHR